MANSLLIKGGMEGAAGTGMAGFPEQNGPVQGVDRSRGSLLLGSPVTFCPGLGNPRSANLAWRFARSVT
jgi:hypothetical protein